MSDIDWRTGQPIDNYRSALQSVEIIFTTRIGEMVMLREFGWGGLALLGRLMVPALFSIFKLLVQATIDLWEPRFVVRNVFVDSTVDEIRRGSARFSIEVDWRPRAHLVPPDFTIEGVRTFGLTFLGGIVAAQ